MPDNLLTRKEVQEKFNVSESTVIRWEKKGMPFYGGGDVKPRYNYDEVLVWLKGQSKVPQQGEN